MEFGPHELGGDPLLALLGPVPAGVEGPAGLSILKATPHGELKLREHVSRARTLGNPPLCLNWAEQGRRIYFTQRRMPLESVDVETGTMLRQISLESTFCRGLAELPASTGTSVMAVGCGNAVVLVDPRSEAQSPSLSRSMSQVLTETADVEVARDGRLLLQLTLGGALLAHDIRNLQAGPIAQLSNEQNSNWIANSMTLHAHDSRLVCSCHEGHILDLSLSLTRPASGDSLPASVLELTGISYRGCGGARYMRNVNLSSCENFLFAGSDEGDCFLWRVGCEKPVAQIPSPPNIPLGDLACPVLGTAISQGSPDFSAAVAYGEELVLYSSVLLQRSRPWPYYKKFLQRPTGPVEIVDVGTDFSSAIRMVEGAEWTSQDGMEDGDEQEDDPQEPFICTASSLGYTTQNLFVCETCRIPEVPHWLCAACARFCHENHSLRDVGVKRGRRCDCGLQNLRGGGPGGGCTLRSGDGADRGESVAVPVRDDGYYNQNCFGKWCYCGGTGDERPMICCVVCEDWFHGRCIESNWQWPLDEFFDMDFYCDGCLSSPRLNFLSSYPGRPLSERPGFAANASESMSISSATNVDGGDQPTAPSVHRGPPIGYIMRRGRFLTSNWAWTDLAPFNEFRDDLQLAHSFARWLEDIERE
jgi:hypothetical protein